MHWMHETLCKSKVSNFDRIVYYTFYYIDRLQADVMTSQFSPLMTALFIFLTLFHYDLFFQVKSCNLQ